MSEPWKKRFAEEHGMMVGKWDVGISAVKKGYIAFLNMNSMGEPDSMMKWIGESMNEAISDKRHAESSEME